MSQNEDLARLESIVEKMIASFEELKQEKAGLESQLHQKNNEIRELRDTLNGLQQEKATIHDRVTGLLGSIEKWETSLEVTE